MSMSGRYYRDDPPLLRGVTIVNMCNTCYGKGQYDMSMCHGFGKHNYHWVHCYDCDGTGIRKEIIDEQVDSRRETD